MKKTKSKDDTHDVMRAAAAQMGPSKFATRGDKLRAEATAEVAKHCAKGKAWEGLQKNVALLGIVGKPRVLFAPRPVEELNSLVARLAAAPDQASGDALRQ